MLTKGKCLKSLDDLDDLAYRIFNRESKEYKILYKLINEHFDNQPYKFEELKPNMWVWDNKTKSYIFIFKPLNLEPIKGLRYANQIINHSAEGYYMDFEENRLFRYEVKNDHNRKSG